MNTDAQRPIIAVGDLVWDVLAKPDTILLPGGDTTGRIALSPGGSAANVAAWIARVGEMAGFVGKVGADVFGDLVVADLDREGVRVHVTRTSAHDTGVILVMIDGAGQRSMVTNQGADFHLLPEDLPEDVLQSCAHVHITAWSLFTEPPRAAALRAAQIAKAAGATVSFDPASYQMIRELGHDKFARITADLPVDILFPNRDEGQALTGERDPQAIAQELRERYDGAIIALKLDRDGCLFWRRITRSTTPPAMGRWSMRPAPAMRLTRPSWRTTAAMAIWPKPPSLQMISAAGWWRAMARARRWMRS